MVGEAEDKIVVCSISVKDMVTHMDGTKPSQVFYDYALIQVYASPTCQKHRRGWRRWCVHSPTSDRRAAVFTVPKVRRLVEPLATHSTLIISWV